MKVLGTQLTKTQVATLRSEMPGKWDLTDHTREKMADRNIGRKDALHCMKAGEMVEFHDERVTRRVLLRDGAGVCIVLDLDERKVVTVYRNDPQDQHRTLRRWEYHWGLVADSVIEGERA